jgi:hypothetical protein
VSLERRILIHRVNRIPAQGLSYRKVPVQVRAEHLPMLVDVKQLRIGGGNGLTRFGHGNLLSRSLDTVPDNTSRVKIS